MKQLIQNYTFDHAAKTITFTDFVSVNLGQLYLITDTTANRILYNFADDSLGATTAANVFTLAGADMTALTDADDLQIIYDCLTNDPVYDKTPVTLADPIAGENLATNRMMTESYFGPIGKVNTAGTVTLESVPGFLHRIIATGGPSGPIQVYDGLDTTGTLIVDYDGDNRFNDEINTVLTVGLTVVTSAATKLTFIGR